MQNQSGRQAAVRAITGTAFNYEGDFHALFDADGIPGGPYNQRLLAWINQYLGTSYADLPGAQHAYAVSLGFNDWNSLNTWEAESYDPDAAAYFTRAGITDETFMNAYNTWVVGAKAAGLYAKHDVLSVFTVPTQAEALFNTLQDDFHPSLANTPTFTAGEGFNGNGSNSGLMWDWNPTIDAVNYSQNSAHIYAWCLTDSQANGCDFGTNASGPFTGGNIRNASGNAQWNTTANSTNTTATASSLGLFGMNRTGSAGSASNLWRNGAKVADGAVGSSALYSGNLYFGAVPGFGASSRKFALLGVTSGLTDQEQSDLYDLWLAFMQAMGLV